VGLHRFDRLKGVFYPQFPDATIKRWDNQAARESRSPRIKQPGHRIARIGKSEANRPDIADAFESVAIGKRYYSKA